MHEFGLCDGIVEAVQRRAGGRPVTRVRVRVGALYRVVDEAFQHAFAHAAEGTEAEHAAVDLVVVPALAVCRSCGAKAETEDILVMCPKCEGEDVDVTGGDELVLESIEYAAPAAGS